MRLYRLNLVKSPTLVEVAEASSILARVILKCTESDNKSGQFRGGQSCVRATKPARTDSVRSGRTLHGKPMHPKLGKVR